MFGENVKREQFFYVVARHNHEVSGSSQVMKKERKLFNFYINQSLKASHWYGPN